jgi:asparagine synthase (glutamine-hydrolysing)
MIKVALREEAAFPWVKTGKVYARGCCYTENGEAMNGADIASLFENCADKESFLEVLSRLNGLFSVIRIEDEHCMAAVDRVRMFPLYWINTDNQLLITDDPIRLSEEYGCTAQNEQSVAEFLAAAHVCGNKTIFRDIFQIQSGHVIFYTNKRLTEHCYYRWAVSSLLEDDSKALSLKGGSILHQAMERMRLSLTGRTAVIPLSGGYDSRAIACHLKQKRIQKRCLLYLRKAWKRRSRHIAKGRVQTWFSLDHGRIQQGKNTQLLVR